MEIKTLGFYQWKNLKPLLDLCICSPGKWKEQNWLLWGMMISYPTNCAWVWQQVTTSLVWTWMPLFGFLHCLNNKFLHMRLLLDLTGDWTKMVRCELTKEDCKPIPLGCQSHTIKSVSWPMPLPPSLPRCCRFPSNMNRKMWLLSIQVSINF